MNNKKLLINQIIDKLIEASDKNKTLTLSVEEVHELRSELEDTFSVPVLTMEEILKLNTKDK